MDRRDFARKIALGGSGLFLLGKSEMPANALKMVVPKIQALNDAKKVFKEKGTCSQTFCFLLNREFARPNSNIEKAADPLAGGLMQSGHQCGMLWGASVACGAECYRRYYNSHLAKSATMETTRNIMRSFAARTGTINCREITHTDFTSTIEMIGYASKIMIKGMENNVCFILAENWLPEAISAAGNQIVMPVEFTKEPMLCSSIVVKKMGGTAEEQTMVAGFAGGLGLSGNACGALSAAIWMKTLDWCKKNPGENPSYFRNKEAKRIFRNFKLATKSKLLCSDICAKKFKSVDDHSEFIRAGGCSELMNILAS